MIIKIIIIKSDYQQTQDYKTIIFFGTKATQFTYNTNNQKKLKCFW